MDVEAYLVKTTIHHATLDMSWKDLNSAKKTRRCGSVHLGVVVLRI